MVCCRTPGPMLRSMNIRSSVQKYRCFISSTVSLAQPWFPIGCLLSCLLAQLIPQTAEVCRLPRSSLASPHNLLWWSSKWDQHSATQPVRDHRCVHRAEKNCTTCKNPKSLASQLQNRVIVQTMDSFWKELGKICARLVVDRRWQQTPDKRYYLEDWFSSW